MNLTIFIHLNYGSNQVTSIAYACGALCSILSLSHNDFCAAKALHVQSTTHCRVKNENNFFIAAIRTPSFYICMWRIIFIVLPIEHLLLVLLHSVFHSFILSRMIFDLGLRNVDLFDENCFLL